MISGILSRVVIILFGTLYPAYASYKAVKTKNVKEYVKWMMYWIVYAIFTCIETFADIFISWLPFYYEIKIVMIIWLMLPATRGASIIYKKFIHPQLSKREEDIDKYISKASDQGYTTLVALGTNSFNYATNVILATALKGQVAISEQMKKSHSLNDLSRDDEDVVDVAEGSNDDEDESDYGDDDDMEVLDGKVVEGEGEEGEVNEGEGVKDEGSEKVKRRRKKRNSDSESLDEPSALPVTRSRARKKEKAYDHKEVYHMGTLPRSTKKTRPALDIQK